MKWNGSSAVQGDSKLTYSVGPTFLDVLVSNSLVKADSLRFRRYGGVQDVERIPTGKLTVQYTIGGIPCSVQRSLHR